MNENIKIGKTKLGFWNAGDYTKQSEIAYSFVAQQSIPELFEVSVFSDFIPFISSFIAYETNFGEGPYNQAKQFSWENIAKKYNDTIKELIHTS